MPRISSPRPLDLTKPFVTSSQSYGSQPFDLSQNLVTWYRDIQGDFVPDLSGRGNTARCAGSGSHDRVTGSNDIPEYNSLNYPLQSFDLSDDATSTSNVQHIKTVNSLGATSALDDHTFTDNLGDVPLSISFWIKLDSTAATQYIAAKGFVASNAEWSIHIDNTNRITFRLNSQGSASNYIESRKTSAFPGAHSGWDYFVLTYDGSETSAGIKIYRNGSDVGTPNSLGSYSGMQNTNYAVCIGSYFTNSNYTPSASDVRGKIHSFAIWKNRALSSSEISALYNAYLNGPGGEARSGFISRSPRLMLRELDDLPGSYPTVRRTGDPTRTGQLVSSFNDTTSIIFSGSENAVFPSMLPKSSGFRSQAVDIIGQDSDISASLPIRSFQHPNHLHYSPTENVGPFDENRTIPATAFFLSGTDPDILPGFTSPVRSKIAIEIDITPQSDTMVMRNVRRRNVGESQPTSDDNTGFLYYNFNRKVWEQIGAQDPATGGSLYYDFSYDGTSTANSTGSFPNQFTWTPGLATVASATFGDIREAIGYPKIGSPTSLMGAPSITKYHATSSQALKLSNFIKSPIFLEKITLQFEEVNAQRVNGGVPPAPTGIAPSFFKSGSIRDIDNYSFFIYRQRRANQKIDSLNDVSGSSRYLVASASMTFWNSPSLSGSNLLHTPAFSHDFNMTCDDSYAVGAFTGSINLEFSPAVCSPQFLNPSVLIDDDGVSTTSTINAWPGSTSISNYQDDLGLGLPVAYDSSDEFSISSFSSRTVKLDSRPVRKFGGEVGSAEIEGSFLIPVSIRTPQSSISPYLLAPDDELVFGLEAGVGPAYRAGNFSHITGSFLRITDKHCKITLYGSMVKNAEEYLSSLNQDLSSNSIHEVIGAEPVLDQFQIEPASSYYGSYLEEFITGSMATPILDGILFTTASQDQSRRVITRASLGQAASSGSLQRFVKMLDASERTYDSCLPSYETFLSGTQGVTVAITSSFGSYSTPDSQYINFTGPPSVLVESGSSFYRNQFPFVSNPQRLSDNTAHVWSGSFPIATDLNLFRTYENSVATGLYLPAAASDLIYRVGYDFSAAVGPYGSRFMHRKPVSATSNLFPSFGPFRYGISNTKPEFSSARWRSDHYGHFRDILEPRQLIARNDDFKPVKIRFMSGSSVISDPTATHSQNLSSFATSSMPYFDDGAARNRSDNPDETSSIVVL